LSKKYNIGDMKNLAESKNGQCISKEYINVSTNLEWKCNVCGNDWSTSPSHILNGSWCPKCAYKKNADKTRLTIEKMQELAKVRNGICLSDKYIDSHEKLTWMCEKGHIWKTKPNTIQQGTWCPECAKMKNREVNTKFSIKDMQNFAEKHEGKCISDGYKNTMGKLTWQCKHGHVWESSYNTISRGGWCPECRILSKPTIEDLQKLAQSRGGKCISNEYKGGKNKLAWECKKGHTWEANYNNIKSGTWCPKCVGHCKDIIEIKQFIESKGAKCLTEEYIPSKKIKVQCSQKHIFEMKFGNIKKGQWCPICAGKVKDTIENMRIIAKQSDGKCLSIEYINTETKLEWECNKGHKWFATPHMIKMGGWCPECYNEIKGKALIKYKIEDMKAFAKTRGGDCLSEKYIPKAKLLWQCSQGHTWEAKYHSLKRGDWCPECNNSRYFNEDKCRYILEDLLNVKFNKNRTALDSKLELDGYNSKFKLAFEYNGQQHYEPIKRFHNSKKVFQEQFYRDQYKINECKEKGIRLIIIPYNESKTDDNLIDFIINCLTKLKIKIRNSNKKDILNDFYKNCSPLNELKEYAKSKSGECLSNEYLGVGFKLTWKCEKGHVWDAMPYHIKNGHWCPHCYNELRGIKIEDMKALGIKMGGKCLSDKIINSSSKLLWECKKGHRWEALLQNIKKGTWCHICGNLNSYNDINEMYKLAENKGGTFLSEEYKGMNTKHKWQCKYGHHWEATPANIKSNNSWCPECYKDRSADKLKEMQLIANERGGNCLSDIYTSAKKMTWQCELGHDWEALPNNIKKGTWCPICRNKKTNL
jgi:hypothetical protein